MNSLSNKADTASNHTINNNGMGNVQPSPGSSSATFTGGWMGGNTASAFPPSSFGQGTNNSFSGFGMASPAPNNFGGSGTGFPFAAPPASPAPSVPSFRTGQNLSAGL